ncbi:GntR family transcriptional regulator [Granulosicoccus antarcticus]|uniref:GntR family transcriptional regulator n=1 Tax=Granulosicoccus antarcticus TaxID=437505 RepID=UPI00197A9765|nr:GntR family transcriptional regulator [Granulosicoccus antarcticus]
MRKENTTAGVEPAVRPAMQIREQIEQDILLGELPLGYRLDEQQLADRFCVSRTPVREALQLLIASGLVEHRPNRGAFVHTPSLTDLLEMFEVMAELEAMCGRLATRRATQEDIQELQALGRDCEAALKGGDSNHYYRENERLHQALYRMSGNRFLAAQASSLHHQLQAYRRLQLRVPYRMRQSMSEHEEIIVAIAAGDVGRVEVAIRQHISIQGERFNDLLSSQRQQNDKVRS